MLFKDSKFKNKANVRKVTKESIFNNIKDKIPLSKCNQGRILEYIDLLIDESKYSIKEDRFYYQNRGIKIYLDIDFGY